MKTSSISNRLVGGMSLAALLVGLIGWNRSTPVPSPDSLPVEADTVTSPPSIAGSDQRSGQSSTTSPSKHSDEDDVNSETSIEPSTEEKNDLLAQILKDVLSNPELEWERNDYGLRGDTKAILYHQPHDTFPWPSDFKPEIPGIELIRYQPESHWLRDKAESAQSYIRELGLPLDILPKPVRQPRRLGIRIDEIAFAMGTTSTDAESTLRSAMKGRSPRITVTLLNAGGHEPGGIIGGCFVYYEMRKVDGRWIANFFGSMDP